MNDRSQHPDIVDLLVLLLENDLTDTQRNELIRWSQTDPDATTIYHDFLRDYSIVSHQIGDGIEYGPSFDTEFDRSLWAALSEYEKAAPLIDVPEEKPQRELIQKVEHKKSIYKFSKSNVIAVLLSAAAILIISFVYFLPPRVSYEPVAQILRSTDSQWHQGKIPTSSSVLMKGPLEVTRGTVTIAMYDGTKIVLQGPAAVQLEQINQLYLQVGQLQAAVPPGATGFTVRSPHGSVVDYGTEFSVEVDPQGGTRVEVFKGMVELRDSPNPLNFRNSQMLTMGQKGQIDAAGKITWTDPARYANGEIRVQWQCPNTTGLWDDSSFWSAGLVRGPELVAEFKANETSKIVLVDASMSGPNKITARRADVGLESRYPVTVQMTGGEVQLEQLWVGRIGLNETAEGQWIMSDGELILKGRDAVLLLVGDECKGLMVINGGHIEIFGTARIGGNEGIGDFAASEGTLEMNGGQLMINGLLEVATKDSLGSVRLNDGRIHAFELRIGKQGTLVITGGTLILEGNKVSSIQGMIDAGSIQSPDHEIVIDYDMEGDRGFGQDKTVITVKN